MTPHNGRPGPVGKSNCPGETTAPCLRSFYLTTPNRLLNRGTRVTQLLLAQECSRLGNGGSDSQKRRHPLQSGPIHRVEGRIWNRKRQEQESDWPQVCPLLITLDEMQILWALPLKHTRGMAGGRPHSHPCPENQLHLLPAHSLLALASKAFPGRSAARPGARADTPPFADAPGTSSAPVEEQTPRDSQRV